MEVSENRYWALFRVVVGSLEGIGTGSSGVRFAILSRSGSCWTWSSGSAILRGVSYTIVGLKSTYQHPPAFSLLSNTRM